MTTKKLVLIGLMTSITCILGPISITMPISPVPITLGLFAIILSTYLLGAKYGTISCLIYMLLGFVGLPVFAGFVSGVGVLLGPTGGYLLGYLFITLLSDFLLRDRKYHVILHALGVLIGLILCYVLGSVWLAGYMDISFQQALLIGVLPYIPVDIIKLFLAFTLGSVIRRRLMKAAIYLPFTHTL